MLRALYERGIAADVIVGTSVGAINGAYIASRPQVPETADGLAEIWRGVHRSEVFPFNPATALLDFGRLEEAAIPLHVVAVDLFSGQERRLSEGLALDAILASAAIPGVFAPVEWEDTELIDGGVANNTPISHALELGCDRIYVLPAGTSSALTEAPHGTLGMALQAMSLLLQQRLDADIKALRGDPRLVVLPRRARSACSRRTSRMPTS